MLNDTTSLIWAATFAYCHEKSYPAFFTGLSLERFGPAAKRRGKKNSETYPRSNASDPAAIKKPREHKQWLT